MKFKKGDRVWVKVPVNATVKSANKRYGYTLDVDDGSEMRYFDDGELERIASQTLRKRAIQPTTNQVRRRAKC